MANNCAQIIILTQVGAMVAVMLPHFYSAKPWSWGCPPDSTQAVISS